MTVSRALRMTGVTFAYRGRDVRALDGVSLELGPGEGVALLGANGAGKSTLLRLAMALEQPSSGIVEVGGRNLHGLAPEDLAGTVGYVFQHPELQLLERTVEAEVAYGLRQRGVDGAEVCRRTADVLGETGLTALAHEHPYDLSPSLRRLVALASALACAPALLLLDEPTAGLDRVARERVAAIVAARRRHGAAVLAVTHDGEFALEALDRAIVLSGGRVARSGAVAAILGEDAIVPPVPAAARLALQLGLPARSLRAEDVAAALAERCRNLP